MRAIFERYFEENSRYWTIAERFMLKSTRF